MFLAMNVVRGFLCDLANETRGDEAAATCVAIHEITDLDLAVMTSSYVQGREAKQLASLQDALVAHLPSMAMLVDKAGFVVAATDRCLDLSSEKALEGRPVGETLPTGILAAVRLPERIAAARATGRLVEVPRIDLQVDGRDRSFHVRVQPIERPLDTVLVDFEDLAEAIRAEGRAARAESLAQLGALSIVAASRADEIDLVVIGTHGRTGLERVLLGSVAERVIRSSPVPVLSTR
jgi:nucleotide-binding universal stress UspA family protein